jgi:hypothetical protein
MADDLASILVRNQLDGKEPSWQSPLAPIGSGQMSQWEWAKNHPTLANFLATGLMGLGAMRSRAGGDRATGAVLNNRAEKLFNNYGDDIMKPGIDANALAKGYQYQMRPAGQPNPAMNYRSPVEMQTGQPRVPLPNNENLPGYGSLQAALEGPEGPAILARIRAQIADEARQGFKPIPGGKE